MWGKRRAAVIAVLLGLFCFSGQVLANIDLEFRPEHQDVLVGQTISVRFYAVSDDETDQSIAALTAILSWRPVYLELVDKVDNGPYEWWVSLFTDDSNLDGLNDTWLDGNALYTAWMDVFGDPAYATPDGLLVTTFRFVALAETPATELILIPEYGEGSYTRVLSAECGGCDVTGELGSATFTILSCGSLGDVDGDCDVDLVDLAELETCLAGPAGGLIEPECEAADLDGNGHVDLGDVGVLQASFTGQ